MQLLLVLEHTSQDVTELAQVAWGDVHARFTRVLVTASASWERGGWTLEGTS